MAGAATLAADRLPLPDRRTLGRSARRRRPRGNAQRHRPRRHPVDTGVPLNDIRTWQWWQLRPISWEDGDGKPPAVPIEPAVLAGPHQRTGAEGIRRKAKPDYRVPERKWSTTRPGTWWPIPSVRGGRSTRSRPTSAGRRCSTTTSGTTSGAIFPACTPRAVTRRTGP